MKNNNNNNNKKKSRLRAFARTRAKNEYAKVRS